MNVHRNEASVTSGISAAHAAYKKDANSKEDAPARLATNTPNIPGNDAAAANIKHSISPAMSKTLQDIINSDNTQTKNTNLADNNHAVEKKISTEESVLLKKIKETVERMNSSDVDKKIIVIEDSGLLKKIKETIEKMNSSDADKKIITEDSELLKKIKEMIEEINSSEWSLAGIREIINKFSTTNQFDLHAIQGVEKNVKEQNMNLEIGAFSLTRVMEKAREALLAQTNTDSDNAVGILGYLDEQEADNKKIAMQTTLEESEANKYNTPNTAEPNANISLDIEA